MIHYPIEKLRYLHAATAFEGTGITKQACVQRSAALALDLRQGLLTFGTVRAATPEELAQMPLASTEPFIHAWVEVGPYLYAPTTLERTNGLLYAVLASDYYKVNGVTDVRRVPRKTFDAIAKRWGLASALGRPAPGPVSWPTSFCVPLACATCSASDARSFRLQGVDASVNLWVQCTHDERS